MSLHAQPVAVAGLLSIGIIPVKRVNAGAQGPGLLSPTVQVVGVGYPGLRLMSAEATTIFLGSAGGQISPFGLVALGQELIPETLLGAPTMIPLKACVERQAAES